MMRSRVVSSAACAWLQLAAMMAAVAACTQQDSQPVYAARALLQVPPLNDSLVASAPHDSPWTEPLPSIQQIVQMPEPPPQPASRLEPWPQPPHARLVTARIGQVEPGAGAVSVVAASTTVAAQQGFWRRGNLIFADKVFLTQSRTASDIPGYRTANVVAGEDLTVYAVDVRTDDLALPGRNVTIVAHNVACGKCIGQPNAAGQPNACGCTIDVTGAPGLSRDGKAANGRDAGSNGAAGASGGDGAAGGTITLRLPASSELQPADRFTLMLVARGGSGGHGQEGGDGVQGATGTTAGSICHLPWRNHNRNVHTIRECRQTGRGFGPILEIRYVGEQGGRGGNGGNGGNNGFNGKGGTGGTVRVIARQTLSGVQLSASGGAGGVRPDDRVGLRGKGGAGGNGGPGARYLVDSNNPRQTTRRNCVNTNHRCCCPASSIWRRCDSVRCDNDYDDSWPTNADWRQPPNFRGFRGSIGPGGNFGTDGKRYQPGDAGAAGSTTSLATSSQPGSVPAAAMRLWLSHVQSAWLSGDVEAVTTTLSLLSSVSPCSDNPSDCADMANTITVLVSQLNSGLDYYGNRPNFVPSLSLGAIQAYTCNTLLPLMQTLETSINDYQAASDNMAVRTSAASGAIQDLQNRLGRMQQDLEQAREEREQLYQQQDQLRTQRDDLRRELDLAIGIFEQAIANRIREDAEAGRDPLLLLFNTFTDVLDIVAQVQKVASKYEADALAKALKSGKGIYDQWNKYLQPLPARLSIDQIAVADSLTQLQGTFKDWSQFNATASKERRKQAMVKEQWEKLIREYTSLPTGEQYQLTLAAYDDACGAYNQLLFVIDARTLAILQAEQNVQALNEQLPQLRNNLAQLMAQDEPWVAQFLYRAYEMAKSAILRNLFQQAAASNFMYGTANAFSVQDTSYNGLLAKSAELQENIFRQLQSTNPSTPTTFVRVLLNNRTVPGFDTGLRNNRIDFQLSPCLPAFYAYAAVFVREFRVRFIGAVARPNVKDAALTVGLSTPGTSIVRSAGPQLTLFPFVMAPRQSDFFYYLSDDPWTRRDPGYFVSEAVPPAATCAPFGDVASVYSPLSPLAPWSLSFPQTGTNRGVDFSAVRAIQIEFRGTKVAPSRGSRAAMVTYCERRGEDWLALNMLVVSDVQFVAGRSCPVDTQRAPGNLNASFLSSSKPVLMCVATAPAALAPEVVKELMLVHNTTGCPDMFEKAGVEFTLGNAKEAVAACVKKGAATGEMIAELRVVRHKDQCKDGGLVGSDADSGGTGFICKVPIGATARMRARTRERADKRVHTRD